MKFIISRHPDPDIYNVLKLYSFANNTNLLADGDSLASGAFKKSIYGYIPAVCYDIIQFIRGVHPSIEMYNAFVTEPLFDDKIKLEIEIFNDTTSPGIPKLRNLTEPDLYCLTELNISCLYRAIKRYGDCNFEELKRIGYNVGTDKTNSADLINNWSTIISLIHSEEAEDLYAKLEYYCTDCGKHCLNCYKLQYLLKVIKGTDQKDIFTCKKCGTEYHSKSAFDENKVPIVDEKFIYNIYSIHINDLCLNCFNLENESKGIKTSIGTLNLSWWRY